MRVRERPIIFSGPMVRAILDGAKTQTRRTFKPQPELAIMDRKGTEALQAARVGGLLPNGDQPKWRWRGTFWMPWPSTIVRCCPYGDCGNRLWVRETWQEVDDEYGSPLMAYRAGGYRMIGATNSRHNPIYSSFDGEAGEFEQPEKWRSPIYMPRWASRLTLEITNVRVQRLQEISEEDAISEGVLDWAESCDKPGMWDGLSQEGRIGILRSKIGSLVTAYSYLWDEINEKRAPWSSNPWVWAITFKRVTP